MKLVYWDSACFLAFLQDEIGTADLCQSVLSEAEEGRIKIVTSTLAIAETLALKGGTPLPKSERVRVQGFFRRSYIDPRAVTRRIAAEAQDLVWDKGIAPKDAIHVATALEFKIEVLHTFDGGLISKTNTLGTPRLEISKPYVESPKFELVQRAK